MILEMVDSHGVEPRPRARLSRFLGWVAEVIHPRSGDEGEEVGEMPQHCGVLRLPNNAGPGHCLEEDAKDLEHFSRTNGGRK